MKDGILIIGFVNIIFSIVAALPTRYLGRKTILLTGHLLITIFHSLIGVFMVLEKYEALYACILCVIAAF